MTEEGWELAIRFQDQSPSYAYGFEAGQFWAEMKGGASLIQRMVMAETTSMIQRMADYLGYIMSEEQQEYGWVTVTLTKTPENPVRKRLKVIHGGLVSDSKDEATNG